MDQVSRRLLQALLCGAAGPLAAALVMNLAAPVVVDDTAGSGTDLGSILAGLVVATLVLGAIGVVAGVGATLAALVVTQCPRPVLAFLVCAASCPVALTVADRTGSGFGTTLVLTGVTPALVRLAAGDRPPAADTS